MTGKDGQCPDEAVKTACFADPAVKLWFNDCFMREPVDVMLYIPDHIKKAVLEAILISGFRELGLDRNAPYQYVPELDYELIAQTLP